MDASGVEWEIDEPLPGDYGPSVWTGRRTPCRVELCTTDDGVLTAFREATILTLNGWVRRFAVVFLGGVLDWTGYYLIERIQSSRIGRGAWEPWYYTCTLLEVAPPAGSVSETLQVRQDEADSDPTDGRSGDHAGDGTPE